MNEPATNRDLYLFITELVRSHSDCDLTLEAYLDRLQRLGHARRGLPALSLPDFAGLLRAAFEPEASVDTSTVVAADGYADWEECIRHQLRDLREMDRVGTLSNELRYFGVAAPSGSQWFNFDPCTYLECAAAGFGGWREGDETGRIYVPGPVAVLDGSGSLVSMDPRDVPDRVVELPTISWPDFQRFLELGQYYE